MWERDSVPGAVGTAEREGLASWNCLPRHSATFGASIRSSSPHDRGHGGGASRWLGVGGGAQPPGRGRAGIREEVPARAGACS